MATSITAVFKGELKKGLTLECMSPEHSKTESEDEENESDSQDDDNSGDSEQSKRKKNC